jgi:hypothetical protein
MSERFDNAKVFEKRQPHELPPPVSKDSIKIPGLVLGLLVSIALIVPARHTSYE